ncbi:hypothetical protein [Paraburkholderia aspalathi]|uniref:Uncharacterized protein n=1 Tax=Paraburkholderia aspalathi TaxID=1324617 RepID=A0A1I7EQY1_9BURK|nr:hypothetical protein [Paraburkholderia aspalathi]SFU26334.1 hypothetical protein SAMN05192563_105224 [Paraburkholderia aspalathi]
MKSPRQRPSKRRVIKVREPSFTKNLRHQILAVSLAFDRSARPLTEITYRLTIMHRLRDGYQLKPGFRAEHRFYWWILMRCTFAEAAAGQFTRRYRRLRRLAALLSDAPISSDWLCNDDMRGASGTNEWRIRREWSRALMWR